jgi:tRNA dimethylallyltransferase
VENPPPTANALGVPTPIVILTGATACGKESAGVLLAERLATEIVTVDSIKVYRGMDIGSAKATPEQRARVRHHCLDLAEPSETFSTGRWLEAARAAIADISARGKVPLLIGGTALYLKALTEGLLEQPAADHGLRARLIAEAEAAGTPALHARLAEVDPAAAARIHPNDRKRIVRGLEVHAVTGRPLSELQRHWDNPNPEYAITWLGLRRGRDDLRHRIAVRVHRMFERGLIDEVRGLLARPGGLSHTASQALAYREVIDHLAGRMDLDETVRRTIDHTRQFAKRQGTWFRTFTQVRWAEVAPDDTAEAVAARLADELAAIRT